jgi:ATP-dependent DNA helicase RecG
VEESEELDLASVTMRFEDLTKLFPNRVGLVHGKIKPQERERILNDFAFGHLDILVATTVIEVGINVPSANLMVIEHAERFGLAQLHQLRGRVGRSDAQGICLLLYGEDLSESGIARLKIMRESNDGFRIAEEDLKIRGGGEVLGTKQSGMPEFRIFDFSQHREMISIAQSDAKVILHNDPKLESPRGKALKNLLYLFEQDKQIKYLKS